MNAAEEDVHLALIIRYIYRLLRTQLARIGMYSICQTTSCMRIDMSYSSSSGLLFATGPAGSGVPSLVFGLSIPLPSPGIGVARLLGGVGWFASSGEAGMISGGRFGILIRLASFW